MFGLPFSLVVRAICLGLSVLVYRLGGKESSSKVQLEQKRVIRYATLLWGRERPLLEHLACHSPGAPTTSHVTTLPKVSVGRKRYTTKHWEAGGCQAGYQVGGFC